MNEGEDRRPCAQRHRSPRPPACDDALIWGQHCLGDWDEEMRELLPGHRPSSDCHYTSQAAQRPGGAKRNKIKIEANIKRLQKID